MMSPLEDIFDLPKQAIRSSKKFVYIFKCINILKSCQKKKGESLQFLQRINRFVKQVERFGGINFKRYYSLCNEILFGHIYGKT